MSWVIATGEALHAGPPGAVSGCFAPVQDVASRFSHQEATLPIVHGADCAHATLLSLQRRLVMRRRRAAGAQCGLFLAFGWHNARSTPSPPRPRVGPIPRTPSPRRGRAASFNPVPERA